MVQIDEAHSSLWPVGLPHTPMSHTSIEDRYLAGKEFATLHPEVISESGPFRLLIDGWDNSFANTYRAWPDKYYLIDIPTHKVLAKSTYGDALLDVDCTTIIQELVNDVA